MQVITKDISIEKLIEVKPAAIRFLSQKGIRCVVCGEPIWGTFEEAAQEKGFSDKEINSMVAELNQL